MEFNICHLYPDLLNVYGDVGNILILKHRAEERGIKVNINKYIFKGEFFMKNMILYFLVEVKIMNNLLFQMT